MIELFIIEVMLITVSGALSPGPLTIATLRKGLDEGWKAGFKSSLGHMTFEFPLVLALALGAAQTFTLKIFRIIIGFVGSFILALFGYMQLKSNSSDDSFETKFMGGSAFWIGFSLSAFNPYFIVWWATVGLKLVIDALSMASLIGILIMYIAHVWIDYAWLSFICYLAFKGKSLLNEKTIKILNLILSSLMFFFSGYFIFRVYMELLG